MPQNAIHFSDGDWIGLKRVIRKLAYNTFGKDSTPTFSDLTLSSPSNIYALSHDSFADFVSDEHVAHSGVTLTAGTGLTGGGDITANRTFAVDGVLEDLDALGVNAADSEFLVGTGEGALAWESGSTVRTSLGLAIGTDVQAYDAGLLSLAGLTYASDSFIKVTATDVYEIRTIAETKTDLSLNNVENTALSTWAGSTNITTVGNLTITDGGTIGQAAGPLMTFDDTGNVLNITGCRLGINSTSPGFQFVAASNEAHHRIHIEGTAVGSTSGFYITANNGTQTATVRVSSTGVYEQFTAQAWYSGNVMVDGVLEIKERAAAKANTAAYGQLWIKDDAPCSLIYTDDAGTDLDISTSVTANNTHRGLVAGNPHVVTAAELGLVIGTNVQAYDAGLSSLAGLTYASDSFIKVTATDVYEIRTIAETKTDLSLNNVENTALSTWAGSTNITTLGAISTVGNITIADGGTIGQAAGPLIEFDDTSNRLEITGCSVGIGTAVPAYKLHVASDAAHHRIQVEATAAGSTSGFYFTANAGAAAATVRVNASGIYEMLVGQSFFSGNVMSDGVLELKERAAAKANTAAYGQLWIKNASPCELWFTDDAGTDTQIV